MAALHPVPESVLPPDVAARLPPDAPPAPWRTRLSATVWWHRATPAALETLPARLRARRRIPLTVAAFVRYAETPVGPYRELVATPVLLLQAPVPAATVPFIAVDSLASIAGGRANWGLPKTLARFDWPEGGPDATAEGNGWSVSARVRARGPALPFVALAGDRQVTPSGGELFALLSGAGRGRLARVTARVAGPRLPGWLLPGSHPALAITAARLRVAAPRAS